MRQLRNVFVACAMMMATTGIYAAPHGVKFHTEELPPFNYTKDGKFSGIATEVLEAMAVKMGSPIAPTDITVGQWSRSLKTATEENGNALYSAARTPDREKLFKWVGPYAKVKIGLIGKKSKGIKLASVTDAAKYKIGTVRDGAPEEMLIKAGIDKNALDRGDKPVINIKKLDTDRIDLYVFNVPTTLYAMKMEGIDSTKYETVHTLKDLELYFAFNPGVSDEVIAAYQKAFEAIKADGTYKAIFSKYYSAEEVAQFIVQ